MGQGRGHEARRNPQQALELEMATVEPNDFRGRPDPMPEHLSLRSRSVARHFG